MGVSVAATDEPAAAPPDAVPDASAAAGFPIRATEERLPNAHVRLTVEVPPSAVEEMYNKEVEWWRKNGKTDVPGFRKSGKKGKKVSAALCTATATAAGMVSALTWPSAVTPFCASLPPCVETKACPGKGIECFEWNVSAARP